MEFTQVEFVAQGLLSAPAQFLDLEFTELVGRGLARIGDVTIYLGNHVLLCETGVRHHVIDGLLAGPALGMHTGVHHQAHGAPDLVDQAAKAFIGRVIDAHFFAQPFRIQGPTLSIGVEVILPAPLGQALVFLLKGYLQVMTWNPLVQGQAHHFVQGAAAQVVGVNEILAGAGAIAGSRLVESGGRPGCGLSWYWLDPIGVTGQSAEVAGQLAIDALCYPGYMVQVVLFIGLVELFIAAQERQERGKVTVELHFLDNLAHFGLYTLHFRQAQGVHRIGIGIQAGVVAQQLVVGGATAGQGTEPSFFSANRHIGISKPIRITPVGGINLRLDQTGRLRAQLGLHFSRNGLRHTRKGDHEHTLSRIIGDETRDRSVIALQGVTGLGVSSGYALFQQGNVLVGEAAHLGHAREQVTVILFIEIGLRQE